MKPIVGGIAVFVFPPYAGLKIDSVTGGNLARLLLGSLWAAELATIAAIWITTTIGLGISTHTAIGQLGVAIGLHFLFTGNIAFQWLGNAGLSTPGSAVPDVRPNSGFFIRTMIIPVNLFLLIMSLLGSGIYKMKFVYSTVSEHYLIAGGVVIAVTLTLLSSAHTMFSYSVAK